MLVKLQALSLCPQPPQLPISLRVKSKAYRLPSNLPGATFSLPTSPGAPPPPCLTSVPSTRGIPAPLTRKAHSYPRVFALPITLSRCFTPRHRQDKLLPPSSLASNIVFSLRPMVAVLFKITTRTHAASSLSTNLILFYFFATEFAFYQTTYFSSLFSSFLIVCLPLVEYKLQSKIENFLLTFAHGYVPSA